MEDEKLMMEDEKFMYSEKFFDRDYEYRHVIIPLDYAKQLPDGLLLSEPEWRAMGIRQSRGWENFAIHPPERHVLLFRRPLPVKSESPSSTGKVQHTPYYGLAKAFKYKPQYRKQLAMNAEPDSKPCKVERDSVSDKRDSVEHERRADDEPERETKAADEPEQNTKADDGQ